jgi:hypothetical protein
LFVFAWITDTQADSTLAYHELTSRKWQPKDYKQAALEIVAIYEDFFRGLTSLRDDMNALLPL